MNRFSQLSKRNKGIIIILSVAILFLVIGIIAWKTQDEMENITARTYTVAEVNLASQVKDYLNQYVIIEEKESDEIADTAVKNYETIVESNINEITEDHVNALESNIGGVLDNYISDKQITEDDRAALSSGIAQIILDTILQQLEECEYVGNQDLNEQLYTLTESLQNQINELAERCYKVNISANIENTGEDTLSLVEEEISRLNNSIQSELEKTKSEVITEVNEKYGNIKDGKDGKDGVNGKDGKSVTGVAGKSGTDGKDGKTTYIAYADDSLGNGFSLTPTESSKYIGTCITTSTSQPTDPILYDNWQIYRNYIITSTTDDSGTTLYIQ